MASRYLPLSIFYGYLTADEARFGKQIYQQIDFSRIDQLLIEKGESHPDVDTAIRAAMIELRATEAHQALVDEYRAKPLGFIDKLGNFLTALLVRK